MPTVLLARHAQASFGGLNYDVLSEHGVRQAAALAEDLERRGVRIDHVYSGGLSRQRDTAEPVARWIGSDVVIDERWDEYDTGDILTHHSTTTARTERAPGSEAPEISSREFQAILERALLDWIVAGGDGPAGEPWPAFKRRVREALTDVLETIGSGRTALVCTSGGVLAATCVSLLGVPDEAFVPFNRVAVNGGVSKIIHGRGGTHLLSFNEHGHLEQGGGSLVTYR